MVRRRLRLVLLSLIIAALLPGSVLAAARQASPRDAPTAGAVGQEGGESYAVALQGAYAYLGIGPRAVVLNVSVPTAPVLTGRTAPLPDIIRGIAASGNTIYVADGGSGLQIVDVVNPASPKWKGSLDTPGSAQNVAVSGTTAYVADGDGGLRIVDVSNPLAPAEVAALTSPALGGEVTGIAVVGNTAYVGAGAGGLVIVDVTAPTNPKILGHYAGLSASNVTVLGATIYVVDRFDISVLTLSVSNPLSPKLVGITYLTGVPDDLYALGSYLYVAVGDAGVDVFRIDPGNGGLYYQFTHDTPGVAHDVAAAGGSPYVYVADGRAGLRVVDIFPSIPPPKEVGSYRTLGDALGVAAGGSRAYVAAGEDGLSVMDLTDPANPTQAGSVDTPGYAQDVVVSGTTAHVADGSKGLAVVDVATPGHPMILKQLPLPGSGYAWAVALQGNFVYLAAGNGGLQIVNVSDPGKPSLVGGGFKPAGVSVWGLAVEGEYVYLAAGERGVRVVNISDPADPRQVAVIPSGEWAQAVALAGGYLYIADYEEGLVIADVTTPASPVIVETYTGLPGAVTNVAVSGRHALVATEDDVYVLDISVPASPVPRVSFAIHETEGIPADVAVGDAVLVADFDGGLRVFNPVDVAVSMVAAPDKPSPGLPLDLNIRVTNHGPSVATEVTFVDTLPAGVDLVSAPPSCEDDSAVITCAIGSLASGATANVTITVMPRSEAFLNRAVVSSGATEIYAPNNAVMTVLGGRAIYLPLVVRQP